MPGLVTFASLSTPFRQDRRRRRVTAAVLVRPIYTRTPPVQRLELSGAQSMTCDKMRGNSTTRDDNA